MAIISTREIIKESFFFVTVDGSGSSNGSRNTADGDGAGQHSGKFIVDFHLAGNPERKIPYYGNNDHCLYQPEGTRSQNILKKYGSSQQHKTYLYKKLCLDTGTQPIRQPEQVTYKQAQQQGKKYSLEA